MATQKILHARMFKTDGKGNSNILYPISKAEDVEINQYSNLPSDATTLDDILEKISPVAFTGNLIPGTVGLENVTNDKQVKAPTTDTTPDHVLTFGEDSSIVKDSGFTIGSSVPVDAKFTDTTYTVGTPDKLGLVKLSSDINERDADTTVSGDVTYAIYTLAKSKVSSVIEGKDDGTLLVNNVSVNVHGLKSAAYKADTDFATSDQGAKADTSIQNIVIGSVTKGLTDDIADVVANTKNQVTTLDFVLPRGDRGSVWYNGVLITGTSYKGTAFATGITSAAIGDFYLNNDTYCIYRCSSGGNDDEALWCYVTKLIGMKGDSGDTGDKGDTGNRGSQWYYGTYITGKSTTPLAFPKSGIESALAMDYYLNNSTMNIYYCTIGGDPTAAMWTYVGTMAPLIDADKSAIASSTKPLNDCIWFQLPTT